MTNMEFKAWNLYCKETNGDMHVVDFWYQLSTGVQNIFLNKVRGKAMGRKVYIAASYTNILSAKKLGEDLEKMNYSVISYWHVDGQSPVDSDYHSSSRAMRDLHSVKQCDIFIELVGDHGSKGGRHCELGMAIAWRKDIMLAGDADDCIFTWLPWIPRFTNIKELLARLKS